MLGVLPPPTVLAGKQRGDAGGIDDPAGADGSCPAVVLDGERLFAAGYEFHIRHAGRAENLRSRKPGAAMANFFVECGAIELIRRQPDLIAAAEFARLAERFHLVVPEPKPQPLFHEMRFVEVLRETEHAAHEIGAHFHGGFAHAARKVGGLFHDQHADAGIFAEEQRGRRRAGKRAADDDDVVGLRGAWRLVTHRRLPHQERDGAGKSRTRKFRQFRVRGVPFAKQCEQRAGEHGGGEGHDDEHGEDARGENAEVVAHVEDDQFHY